MSKVSGLGPDVRVTVAVSTMGSRCATLVLPARTQGIHYVILVQRSTGATPLFERDDVTCIALGSTGLSNSRNAALDVCDTPYLLFSDDDLVLYPAGILKLADDLDAHSDHAFAAGWRDGRRDLPAAHRMRWYNSGHICAPELMVRHKVIMAENIRFDPAFGVGADHPIGEDFIFLCDMLRAGLRGRCLPVVTGAHAGPSTGDVWNDPSILAARREMISRCFGAWAPLVRLGYGAKHMRRLGGAIPALRFIVGR